MRQRPPPGGPRSEAAMTRNTVLRLAAVSVALTLASGCGGAESPSAPAPAAGKASSAASASASAVVTPKPRKADDQRLATSALVTAKDLGKPWVKPKKVNTTGKRGQLCPGRPSVDGALRPLARAGTSLVRGTRTGAAIGSFTIRTYPE